MAINRGQPLMAALVLLLCLAAFATLTTAKTDGLCRALFNGKRKSLLLFADPGDFSSTAEAKQFIENLKNPKPATSVITAACANGVSGELLGQKVAIVTTGIGPLASSRCTNTLLNQCGDYIKEVIYMGTSGWSPAVGGILNPQSGAHATHSCMKANTKSGKGMTVRQGDICISAWSVNWDCKKASWTQQCGGTPNLCYRPEETNNVTESYLYGKCIFNNATSGSQALALELLDATKTPQYLKAMPRPVARIQEDVRAYWQRMQTGVDATGQNITYYNYAASDPPTVFDYKTCMEIDSQFFYSGVPWELSARAAVATAINGGLRLQPGDEGFRTSEDVVAVAAMEAIGFMDALEAYNAQPATAKIPYANVRGASNILHGPLQYDGEGVWSYGPEVPEDFANGYAYAIATASVPILTMFQLRCEKLAAAGSVSASSCQFKIVYGA